MAVISSGVNAGVFAVGLVLPAAVLVPEAGQILAVRWRVASFYEKKMYLCSYLLFGDCFS